MCCVPRLYWGLALSLTQNKQTQPQKKNCPANDYSLTVVYDVLTVPTDCNKCAHIRETNTNLLRLPRSSPKGKIGTFIIYRNTSTNPLDIWAHLLSSVYY